MHKNLLVIIPARGGSKGIPHKNIYPIAGKPLLEYTIECVLSVRREIDIAVSTDDTEIMKVAQRFPGVVVVKRPEEIAGDKASTESALLHALHEMEQEQQKKYDAVITLQPTSPLRKSETIELFIDAFLAKWDLIDAQLTLTETRGDYWIKNSGDTFGRLHPDAPRRRQDREPMFIENSAIYITKVQALKETNSVLGTKVDGYVIDEIEGTDINEMSDIWFVQGYMQMLREQ